MKIFLVILLFFCFYPLIEISDNYENFLEKNYYQNSEGIYKNTKELNEFWHFIIQPQYIECSKKIDGSSIQARFIPFGTLVTACSDDMYYHFLNKLRIHFTKK